MILANQKFVENVSCSELTQNGVLKLLRSKILKQMINFCIKKHGVGLAAIQVGIRQKFFVAYNPDIGIKGQINVGSWYTFMNPEYKLSNEKDNVYEIEECCLTYGKDNKYRVERYKKIIATWDEVNASGNIFRVEKTFEGLFSQIFQHECDHCFGTTIAKIGIKVENNET